MGGRPLVTTRTSKSKVFLFCLLAFAVGVGFSSFVGAPFILLFGLGLALLVSAFLWSAARRAALVGLFFIGGMARLAAAAPDVNDPSHIAFYNGRSISAVGIVSEEPDVRLDHQKLVLRLSEMSDSAPVQGRLLVKTDLFSAYKYGDVVHVECAIQAPEKIENFAYDKYLARYDIYSVCWRGELAKIGAGQGSFFKAGLYAVKGLFIESLNQNLREPHASFMAGLLVGARRGIPPDLLEVFNRTGTTHIIAISGSNIAIVAAALLSVLAAIGCQRRKAFWILVAGITTFVFLTGATASVVRAGIMGVLVLLAKRLGRPSRAANAMAFTAFMMILVNPKILVFDAGFQLSFLATLGIVYIEPIASARLGSVSDRFGLKGAVLTTLSAIIATAPLVLFQFGRLSAVAPLANLLILPVVPAAMLFGFLAALFGLIHPVLGEIASALAWLCLEYIILVCEFLASLKFASLDYGGFHWVLMLAMYGAIAWGVWRFKNSQAPSIR